MVDVQLCYDRLECPVPLMRFAKAPDDAWVGSQYSMPMSALGENAPVICKRLTLCSSNAQFGPPAEPYKVFDVEPDAWPIGCRDATVEEDPHVKRARSEAHYRVPRAFGISQFGCPQLDFRQSGSKIGGEFTGVLYDWQEPLVAHVVSRLQCAPFYGGVLQAGCGLGKTCMAIAVAMRLGVRCAIAVNKAFLLNQWEERIHQFVAGAVVGQIQGDKFMIGDFTVVMLQTMSTGRYPAHLFNDIGLLIVDEVHHLPARTYHLVAKYFAARHSLGLSATLQRSDGNEACVFWQLGPLLAKATRKQEGNRVPVTVRTILGVKPVEPMRSGRLDRVQLVNRMCKMVTRNNKLCDAVMMAVSQEHRVLLISERVQHLNDLQEILLGKNLPWRAVLYTGEKSVRATKQRDEAMKESPTVVLTTKQMAAEAFDWPECTCIVLACPVPVGGALEQIVGRCQRGCVAPGERPRLIVDVCDISPALNNMATSRRKWYASRGYILEESRG